MKLFRVFDAAEFVLDACVVLDLRRLPPERGDKFLAFLEELEDQVWITHQSWYEYRKNLPSARNERKEQSLLFRKNATKNRDNSVNLFKQFAAVAPLDVNPEIHGLKQVFESFMNHVSAWSQQPCEQPYDEIETRINGLFRGRVGKKLRNSLQEDVPNIWAWRYDRGIPPGLKDSGKPEPQRYGDLIGWLQIKHRANDTGRPTVFITNDVKSNDWFFVENGELRGPHPKLVQELRDEVGVELYIFTSDQFIRLASKYLRWRESEATFGNNFRLITPSLMPDFGKVAPMQHILALTAMQSVFANVKRSEALIQPMLADIAQSKAIIQQMLANIAQCGALVQPMLADIAHSKAIIQPMLTSLGKTEVTIQHIFEQMRRTTDIVKPYFEQQRRSAEIMKPFLEQKRSADEIVESILDQQRRAMEPILEVQRRTADAFVKPILGEQRRAADAVVKPILEEQRRAADAIMKPYVREQQRVIDNILKNISW